MLVPYWRLEGQINLIKEITFNDDLHGKWETFSERTWEDEKGNRSIIIESI